MPLYYYPPIISPRVSTLAKTFVISNKSFFPALVHVGENVGYLQTMA